MPRSLSQALEMIAANPWIRPMEFEWDRFQRNKSCHSNVSSRGNQGCSHNRSRDLPPSWKIWNSNMATQISREICDVMWKRSITYAKRQRTRADNLTICYRKNDNFTTRLIVIGNNTVERVTTYKLLDIIISNDLKWSEHIDYISKKASKCLYSLRILKKVGFNRDGILKVYLTTIRPILEYGVQVWQDIPEFLSNKLESIQKRALRIIFPIPQLFRCP